MAPDVTPAGLRSAVFRTAFRGFDPAEVESLLNAAALKLEQLDTERKKLQAKLDETPSRDLENEFDSIGREVAAILQSTREAAEAMRERASLDAAKWRSEAMEEAAQLRKDAAADAEALRRDAWVTSSDMLEQTANQAEIVRANAERDVLTIMGEAEREAHRLTSAARREAEDLVRNATMDAEKIIADSTARRDDIIDGANRQAAAAQERTRALEQRRDELLVELENVRSTLTRLEGSLEERREALDLAVAPDSTSVRVVHPPAEAKEHWELGETVRVVHQEERPEPSTGMADETTDEVSRLQQPAHAPAVPEPEPEPAPEPAPEPEPEPAPEPVVATSEPEPAPEPVGARQTSSDDLSALFAALRSEPAEAQSPEPSDSAPPGSIESTFEDEPETTSGVDWIEVREERLIPITNRALRGVKKAMTEVQNVALDSLRTDDGWRPDEASIAESVHAELVAVWSESFAAGHAVAEQMTGSKLKRPPTPPSKADHEFAAALAGAVDTALQAAGDGSREQQSAASRVFRVWRSDEAERRIRSIALSGYEAGLESSRSVSTG